MKSSIPALLRRHSLIVFLALTILISWIPWYTGGAGFFVFGPSIAGVIVIAFVYGKAGLRDLVQRTLRWRVGIVWWAIALFLPALLTLISIGINVLLGGKIPGFTFFRQEWYLAPVFFLITIVGGPLGEEFGWRGFALPTLQGKWGPLIASLIIGTVWGLWHVPQFLLPGSLQAVIGMGLLPVYVVGEIVLSILMTWVYNKTGGSLLVAGLLYHNADNFWGVTLATEETMTTALQGGAALPFGVQLWEVSIAVGVLAAIILLIATKGRLGFPKDKEKQTPLVLPQKVEREEK
jgi:membrane protease YdiL (CAAX protease family)